MAPRIRTVVWVMLENRSFDNMLGHLSYEKLMPGVNGLAAPLDGTSYENVYQGEPYYPFLAKDVELTGDLPHERTYVATQLAPRQGTFSMSGFVQAAHDLRPMPLLEQSEPMGFFASKDVPVTSFLARNFVVCDQWFSPVPSSTQPNRSMAFNGKTFVDDTKLRHIPSDYEFVTAWLERRNLRWRAYHDGTFPFFLLFGRGDPFSDDYKPLADLTADFADEPDDTFPHLVVVDPAFGDDPFVSHPNDDHPPTRVGPGEGFLSRVYQAVSRSRRWQETLLVITCDEHGGFFDHVPPPHVPFANPAVDWARFESLGPRVPAIVASPALAGAGACHELFDHTSVLQLIADNFAGGESYSASVKARIDAGVQSLTKVLSMKGSSQAMPQVPKPVTPRARPVTAAVLAAPPSLGTHDNPIRSGFRAKAQELMQRDPEQMRRKFPLVAAALSPAPARKPGRRRRRR